MMQHKSNYDVDLAFIARRRSASRKAFLVVRALAVLLVATGVCIQNLPAALGDVAGDRADLNARLGRAVAGNQVETVQDCLRRGADPNAAEAWSKLVGSPLHDALFSNRVEIVKLLVNAGADVEARDPLREAPLHLAVRRGPPEVVELLISKGANADEENALGMTPLFVAAASGNVPAMQALLARQVKVNARNGKVGATALFGAVAKRRVKAARFLLSRGATVNATAADGSTPLHSAVHYAMGRGAAERSADLEMIELLLSCY